MEQPVHDYITHRAVERLFADAPGGLIRGMTQEQYFHEVNAGQKYMDRIVDRLPGDAKQAEVMRSLGVDPPLLVPSEVLGPTAHSAWNDPAVQRQHAMANPYLSGRQNLAVDRDHVVHLQAAALPGAHEVGPMSSEHQHNASGVGGTALAGTAGHHGPPAAGVSMTRSRSWSR